MFCQCSHHIVGFVAVHSHHRDAKSLQDALDVGHRVDDVIGCGLAVGLVVLEVRVAERGCTRVERHGNVRGFLFFDDFVKHIGKTQYGGGVQSLGSVSRTLDHGIIGSENQAHSVYQKKFWFHYFFLVPVILYE